MPLPKTKKAKDEATEKDTAGSETTPDSNVPDGNEPETNTPDGNEPEGNAEGGPTQDNEPETEKEPEQEPEKGPEKEEGDVAYHCTGGYKLRNPQTGDVFYPRNSPHKPCRPKKIDGWLKAQIAAGVIEKD